MYVFSIVLNGECDTEITTAMYYKKKNIDFIQDNPNFYHQAVELTKSSYQTMIAVSTIFLKT